MASKDHSDLVALELFDRFAAELRSGFAPAVDNSLGFFHAVGWKEPWLIGLLAFHVVSLLITIVVLLLITIISRRNVNFQLPLSVLSLSGVCFAETINNFLINNFLAKHWKSFAGQNYSDTHGLFISALWSVPLLFIAGIVLVNTVFVLSGLKVKWKRAELKRRSARVSRGKQD